CALQICSSGQIEVDAGKGGVWGHDATRLWRFRPNVEQKRNLINGSEARKVGLELLKAHGGLTDVRSLCRLGTLTLTGAVTAYSPEKGARRQIIKEDTTVLVQVEVDASAYGL